jgi:predicted metal-binding membrane protein
MKRSPMTRFGIMHIQLIAITAFFWMLVVWSIDNMDQPVVKLMMPMHSSWSITQWFFVWLMWAVMMAAMMLPSAFPMVVTFQRIAVRKGSALGVWAFVAAYLLVWSSFSGGAAALQWGLQSSGLLSHMLVVTDKTAAAGLLILIGASQWTRLKEMCLHTCRTPVGFFTSYWRDGTRGAFLMGMRHGAFCVGCCWALMALLFVFGVMNLMAIALVSALVVAEKTLPYGDYLVRIVGVFLILWGVLIASGLS